MSTTEQTNDVVSQEQQARAAGELARRRIRELSDRRQGVALAATIGEDGAKDEAEDLDRRIQEQQRAASLADAAVEEAKKQTQERRQREAEEARQDARKEFDWLVNFRRGLLQGVEDAMTALEEAVKNVEMHTRQQTTAAAGAGLPAGGDVHALIAGRIATRLAPLVSRGVNHTSFLAPLPELDPMTATAAEMERSVAADRDRHAAQAAEQERVRELSDRIEARRRELLTEEGARDPATTDAQRAAAERRVEQRLADEIPEIEKGS